MNRVQDEEKPTIMIRTAILNTRPVTFWRVYLEEDLETERRPIGCHLGTIVLTLSKINEIKHLSKIFFGMKKVE